MWGFQNPDSGLKLMVLLSAVSYLWHSSKFHNKFRLWWSRAGEDWLMINFTSKIFWHCQWHNYPTQSAKDSNFFICKKYQREDPHTKHLMGFSFLLPDFHFICRFWNRQCKVPMHNKDVYHFSCMLCTYKLSTCAAGSSWCSCGRSWCKWQLEWWQRKFSGDSHFLSLADALF